jgi:hypothetical protein
MYRLTLWTGVRTPLNGPESGPDWGCLPTSNLLWFGGAQISDRTGPNRGRQGVDVDAFGVDVEGASTGSKTVSLVNTRRACL